MYLRSIFTFRGGWGDRGLGFFFRNDVSGGGWAGQAMRWEWGGGYGLKIYIEAYNISLPRYMEMFSIILNASVIEKLFKH